MLFMGYWAHPVFIFFGYHNSDSRREFFIEERKFRVTI